jgi:hypothetical protein
MSLKQPIELVPPAFQFTKAIAKVDPTIFVLSNEKNFVKVFLPGFP